MADEEIVLSLKNLGIPTFGTKNERMDRLKKHCGIAYSEQPKKEGGLKAINKIQQQRDERRAEMNKKRQEKLSKEIENEANGKSGDVEFESMIDKERYQTELISEHVNSKNLKLTVCVRKRPIFLKELQEGEIDCVSASNPEIKIFSAKYKVDGITKCLETNHFVFDNVFNENEGTEEFYECSLKNALNDIFDNGCVTLFAYGQTGSGKTFTMKEIQEIAVEQIFSIHEKTYKNTRIFIAFYEIYGGRCYDLLANKAKVQILEDKNNCVVIQGLYEKEVNSEQALLETIEFAFDQRTTHSTSSNDTSSRSHAICQILIKSGDEKLMGKLILVDLAGSERAQDTQSNNRQRRLEGAEINKSLLALKECIRAMDSNSTHVPFRASKLTLSIRDSFISKDFNNRVIMIACVCPGTSSADHSVNTLRYADRLKGKKLIGGILGINSSQLNEIPLPQILESKKEILPAKPVGILQDQINETKMGVYLQTQSSKEPVIQKSVEVLSNKNIGVFSKEQPAKINENIKKGQRSNSKDINKQNFKKPQIANDSSPLIAQKKDLTKFKKQSPPKNSNEEGERQFKMKSDVKKDFDLMKKTLRENQNDSSVNNDKIHVPKLSEEYFNFHEKIGDIIDLHDELMSVHLNIIREDASLLNQESEILKKSQTDLEDYEIDNYVHDVENIVKKKMHIYKVFYEKIKEFKRALKEEEEISSKVKDTLYY